MRTADLLSCNISLSFCMRQTYCGILVYASLQSKIDFWRNG